MIHFSKAALLVHCCARPGRYRFRSIDQTRGKPALQGGIDFKHVDGYYAGLWASLLSGNSYPRYGDS